ncbi:HDIG domain-containing metalloprotein [Herbidospora sp. NBRC 101105]|uniref:HDIG domain-containing metalloprotein n=1 Tax=Herbidospora sp. NBRC 101105 TaxID=3032195 RepID=UPI0024A303C8|nr:HDIG domain-containing metalloprotein [Herbidospora sp. NBRC 101105]GLX93594.1 phosphohydrolase [Herbidospora sp. NBRC 101105]
MIPTDREIRALHRAHAPSPEAFEVVFTHCEIVWAIAEQLLARCPEDLDADLVRAGCLLHDIGVYRLHGAPYVRHGVLGHEILAEAGWPEPIRRFASCHTGVGLRRADILAQNLPIPLGDYVAETGEEALVMYADKFHSKSDPPTFYSPAAFAARIARFGADKVDLFDALRLRFGDPDLAPFIARYGHRLV